MKQKFVIIIDWGDGKYRISEETVKALLEHSHVANTHQTGDYTLEDVSKITCTENTLVEEWIKNANKTE